MPVTIKRSVHERKYRFEVHLDNGRVELYQAHRNMDGRWVMIRGRDRLNDEYKTITAIEKEIVKIHEREEIRC